MRKGDHHNQKQHDETFMAESCCHGNHEVSTLPRDGVLQQNGGVYTCPMDPDILKKELGTCPKCGMDLVPIHQEPGRHGGHADMEESFKKRFLLGVPLTLVVLVLSSKIQEWFGFTIDFSGRELVLFVLASVMVWYAGLPFYRMAKGELAARTPAMMSLVSLAVLAGYFFSVAATFLFEGESLYWEVSTLVLAFLFGHWIEMRAVRGASGALAALTKLIPPTAHKMIGKEMVDVRTETLKKGDHVLVRPGENVPIDGIVLEGESSVNESMVTGESRPVVKKKGNTLIGGTINNDGSLTARVTKTGQETAVAQMVELIRQAQETKPAIQKLADRAAGWLTYIAVTVGIGTFLFWFFIAPMGAIFAGTLAIAVIVIACPHALGLAIPTVTTITTAIAAKHGILIRDMRGAEIARKITTVIFDKTGTLTQGAFGVRAIVPFKRERAKEAILQIAASLEQHSSHVLRTAIVAHLKKEKQPFLPVKQFKNIPGNGVEGVIGGRRYWVGNQSLMEAHHVWNQATEAQYQAIAKDASVILVADRDGVLGAMTLVDKVRPESKEAIQALKDMGIKTAMLTGDSEEIASAVAAQLGIDTVFAEVLPAEKVQKVKALQGQGEIVAMVGDGVNDAASLAQAHVGIAIGAGTDVAVASAEIVLVKDDPRDVVKAIQLSRKTNAKMVQNLVWAAGYNLIAIPVAAGVLFPFSILLRPEWAALLMSASSVIVVVNALSLRNATLSHGG